MLVESPAPTPGGTVGTGETRLCRNPNAAEKVDRDRQYQPQSGERFQPTAQAVGWNGKPQSPNGAKDRLRHSLETPLAPHYSRDFVSRLADMT